MDNNCISRRLFLNTLIIMNKYLHITSWPEDKMVTLGGRVTAPNAMRLVNALKNGVVLLLEKKFPVCT